MNELYLAEEEARKVRADGFIVTRQRRGWKEGTTINIYAGMATYGWNGTVVEEYEDGKCLIEIW